jgi:signal transduction histidine kinase
VKKIRVLIADDDRALACALADTLESADDVEVVAVRDDCDAVVRAAAELHPDVVLVDVRMPGGGGAAATKRMLAQQPSVAVVGYSAREDATTATEMLQAGAVAYVVKGMPEEEILEAIRRASRGQMSIPAALGLAAVRDLAAKLPDSAAPATRAESAQRRVRGRRPTDTHELAERRSLMANLVHAQEEERRKIAADIHDDSIQAMTAVSLRLQQLRRLVTTDDQQQLIARLDEAVCESITRLRRLLFDLRPPMLDRTGLGPAVRELLERLRSDMEIEYELEDRNGAEPSGEVGIELYRIAQEALANVRKHSGAKRVEVSLQRVESGIHVRVADDGVGFDVSADGRPGHLGLVAMRERATIGGGWFTVDSTPGHGTLVDFWLPDEREQVSDPAANPASLTTPA